MGFAVLAKPFLFTFDENFKSMKKLFIILLIIVIASGCNNVEQKKSDNSSEIKLLDRLIKNRLEVLERFVDNDYLRNEIVQCKKIKIISEKAYASIFNSEYEKPAIDSFYILLNNYKDRPCVIENDYFFKYRRTLKENKESALLKIKMIELSLIDEVVKMFDGSFFHFVWIKGVVQPKRNVIKLGEQFEAEVYPAGNYNSKEYSIIINGDTINDIEGGCIPNFKFTPVKRGITKLNGSLVIKHQNSNSITFPFTYDVYVE